MMIGVRNFIIKKFYKYGCLWLGKLYNSGLLRNFWNVLIKIIEKYLFKVEFILLFEGVVILR